MAVYVVYPCIHPQPLLELIQPPHGTRRPGPSRRCPGVGVWLGLKVKAQGCSSPPTHIAASDAPGLIVRRGTASDH
jgi:hypothetical protein